MNKYEKILQKYHESILESCGPGHKKKKKVAEEDDKKSAEYQAYFKKMLKKFGVTEPDQLKGDKKKEFFDAVDKGWKADKETDVDEGCGKKKKKMTEEELDEAAAAITLDDVIGNANQLIVQLKAITKKKKDKSVEKAISVLGDIMKNIKTRHFKEGVAFGASFTTPSQEMTLVINEIERLINNFKQRGGDFKTKVPELQKAYKILYKSAMGR